MDNRDHAAALGGLLACLALALLLYHSLAGGTLLSANAYDSYSLQAENWLAGRNYIAGGENYPWLELAVYGGRYYQSFPPVPALWMLPWVLFFGSAAAVPSNLAMALVALLCAAGCYACCARAGLRPAAATCLTLFVSFGSNAFWLSTSGGVWFMAQMLGLCLAFWGLFFALRDTLPATAAASLCLALAVGCRPFYAALLAVWLLYRLVRERRAGIMRAALPALLPAAVVACCLMGYNLARFGNPLEFGHSYLPEFTRAANGQFSPVYLASNLLNLLRPVTLDSSLQLHFELFNGFLFFLANPLFLLWAFCGVAVRLRREPRSAALPLPAQGWFTVPVCLLLTLLTCMHRTMGGWQFGTRYLVDLFPWVVLWFLNRPAWRPGTGSWTLCGAAILFNLYGAVYMLQT